MTSYLFLEVNTYLSVNRMGLELGKYVADKYDQTIINKKNFESVLEDILQKKKELETKYPRCRPFIEHHYHGSDRYGKCPRVYVKPDSTYNDNIVFSLISKNIREKEEEGGES